MFWLSIAMLMLWRSDLDGEVLLNKECSFFVLFIMLSNACGSAVHLIWPNHDC